ncbi:MAG TPA: DUF4143 domain-containing protein [Methanocorpusculum sp.]|nr:DUF4143 domain-containing protein [Methanocorpusculum sp.]
MKEYRKRIVDTLLSDKLEATGAVLIEGPKWCGKTTTAEQVAKSIIYLSNPAQFAQYSTMAETQPQLLLEGDAPRLLDEWQLFPKLWDAVRFEVDHRREEGQFILTGSAVPPDTQKILHTGTGRFSWIKMRPMSLYESEDSNGSVSLSSLFISPDFIKGTNLLTLENIVYLICRGGWPNSLGKSEKIALIQARSYYDSIVKSDINRSDRYPKSEEYVKRLMRSFARNQGSQISNAGLVKDIVDGDENTFSLNTLSRYIDALKTIFVIENLPAWNPNLRSKTAIRSAETRYFTDPSIATAALGIGPGDLLKDLNTCGFLFETLCVRDLRVYADALDGTVYHYRDKSGLECDTVIHLRNGAYGLIEIKIGGDTLIEEGAASLLKLREKIDTDSMREPAFMMILTAVGPYAYRRPDGIFVVPIGCLGP